MFTDKDIARFWKHVDKRSPDDCWPTDLDSHTIACYQRGKRTNYSLRKFAWACERGEMLPDDISLMATCGNEKCVNPAHMQALKRGTKKADLNRGASGPVSKAVSKAKKPTPKRELPSIYYLAWMAGYDLKALPNGRYHVVRRQAA